MTKTTKLNYVFLPLVSLAFAAYLYGSIGVNGSDAIHVMPPISYSSPVDNTVTNMAPTNAITGNTNIGPTTFQTRVIDPVLKQINLYSAGASKLLLGTAIQESFMGKLSKNIFQIEQATVKDINNRILSAHPNLRNAVQQLYNPEQSLAWNLKNNVKYEVAMARLVYLKSNQNIPDTSNVNTLGQFWKKYYNTYLGKGKASQFSAHFASFISSDQQASIPTADIQSV